MKNDKLEILGFSVNTTLTDLVKPKQQMLVNTINSHSYCVTKRDVFFAEALRSSDLLFPDGVGIVLAARILRSERICRIAGADLHQYLLEALNSSSGRVFYLGSTDSVLKMIKERINREYPNVTFGGYSPPYKLVFSCEDDNAMITAINSFHPHVLFIGMTAPKQEKWAYANREAINAGIIASVGAVFDFYAGTVQRAPSWMINLGLEWFYRLVKEPRRMWRRYLIGNFLFLYNIFKEKYCS